MLIHGAHICVVVYYVVYVYAHIMHVAVSGGDCFMSNYKRRSLAVCAKCVCISSRSNKQRLPLLNYGTVVPWELQLGILASTYLSIICRIYYCMARNFWGRKVSRTLHFARRPRKFSPWNSGHATPTYTIGSVSAKFSLWNSHFPTSLQEFLPRKFPAIQYVFVYNIAWLHTCTCSELSYVEPSRGIPKP